MKYALYFLAISIASRAGLLFSDIGISATTTWNLDQSQY